MPVLRFTVILFEDQYQSLRWQRVECQILHVVRLCFWIHAPPGAERFGLIRKNIVFSQINGEKYLSRIRRRAQSKFLAVRYVVSMPLLNLPIAPDNDYWLIIDTLYATQVATWDLPVWNQAFSPAIWPFFRHHSRYQPHSGKQIFTCCTWEYPKGGDTGIKAADSIRSHAAPWYIAAQACWRGGPPPCKRALPTILDWKSVWTLEAEPRPGGYG